MPRFRNPRPPTRCVTFADLLAGRAGGEVPQARAAIRDAADLVERLREVSAGTAALAVSASRFEADMRARGSLPTLRAQRAGHVITISSSAGFASGAGRGLYSASKFAVEGVSEALQAELAPLGIHVTIVEPGSFRTDFLTGTSKRRPEVDIPDYADTVGRLQTAIDASDGRQPGDPAKAAAAVRRLVAGTERPLRLQLGSDCVQLVEGKIAAVADELARWRELAHSTDFAAE